MHFECLLHFVGNIDYYPGPYSVTIPAGETRASFDILIAGDTALEKNEVFTLSVNTDTLPTGGVRIYPYSVSVTIQNDDCKLYIKLSSNF